MSPRRKAAMQGQRQYEGKPCKACGATLRYTSNAGCVECQKATSRASALQFTTLVSNHYEVEAGKESS